MRSLLLIITIIALMQLVAVAQYLPSGTPSTTSFKNPDKPVVSTKDDSLQSIKDREWDEHLIINSDWRVDSLIQIHREENQRKKGFEGYRVQIAQGTMEEIRRIEAKFLSNYENIKTHPKFDAPDFRLKVGDFRTRSEAIKFKQLLKAQYPASYVVEDIIEFPELLTTETTF
jgi:hypothetical protein